MNEHAKILFSVDGPSGADVESVWAHKVDDGFAINNIPFYARDIALGDIVKATPDETGALWFGGIMRASGHSTVRLWFARPEDVASVRAQLRTMRCPSELSELPRLVAVDIPEDVPYEEVKRFLERGEADEIFEYEEACLGFME